MYSQLGADLWVLEQHPDPGYWLEIGCADGTHLSNTRLLEEHGWNGLSVDPFPTHWETRKVQPVKEVVWDKNAVVSFTVAGELSGITDGLMTYKDQLVDAPVVNLQTVTPTQLLLQHNVPKVIDYLSLDTEGTEFDILSVFPFDHYRVKYISVEHNFEELKLRKIIELLTQRGYRVDKSVKWDIFFVYNDM